MAGVYAYADNTITVTEGTEAVPANMADMQTANDGGGWGVMTNPFAGVYIIDANVDFGDGATATYFTSKDGEMVYGKDGEYFSVLANATLQLGRKISEQSRDSVFWSFQIEDGKFCLTGSILKVYGSVIDFRSPAKLAYIFETEIKQSIITNVAYTVFKSSSTVISGQVYFTVSSIRFTNSPSDINDVHCNAGYYGIYAAHTGKEITVRNISSTNNTIDIAAGGSSGSNINVIDPVNSIQTVQITGVEDAWIKEQYTVNINVKKADGTNLAGVNVKCFDKDDNEAFSVNTDANGDIAEQTVTYKKWEGTDETLTEYTPHKFVVSKTGYETLEIENYTVDRPVIENWQMPQTHTVVLEDIDIQLEDL